MKATNLCEWLRGIMLVRRGGMSLRCCVFFLSEIALNLCKQWKEFMRDDHS